MKRRKSNSLSDGIDGVLERSIQAYPSAIFVDVGLASYQLVVAVFGHPANGQSPFGLNRKRSLYWRYSINQRTTPARGEVVEAAPLFYIARFSFPSSDAA
ncbi:MAG TPA: hypothetical protein VGG72_21550 [Bryobacteraceae bacterium]|jgi:hypothetical protein